MSKFKKINNVKRAILKALTNNIGSSSHNGLIDNLNVKRVLLLRPNRRLGNQLLMTPLVQEVLETFPNCKIDLFVQGGISPIIFKNYERIDRIIILPKKPLKEFFKYVNGWLKLRRIKHDIAINVAKGSSSGRLSTKFARSRYKFYGEQENVLQTMHIDYMHLAKTPVYSLRHSLSKMGIVASENKKMPFLDLKLNAGEIAEGGKILKSLTNNEGKRTICLYTYATGAKCYSESWWSDFYEKLKRRYTDFNIVEILPVENVSMIGFKAPSLYSKDIREIGAVLANADIFIGADCGIMHLASSVNAPTLGFFSVTNAESYEPYNRNSKALTTTSLTIDDIFKEIDLIVKN